MSIEPSYETGANMLDCDKTKDGVYQRPSYSLKRSCDQQFSSCSNRSYSAYALDSAYNGYYDACIPVDHVTPQCDLVYLNAKPKTVIDCWNKCCGNPEKLCTQACETQCVVGNSLNGSPVAPKPSPPQGNPFAILTPTLSSSKQIPHP